MVEFCGCINLGFRVFQFCGCICLFVLRFRFLDAVIVQCRFGWHNSGTTWLEFFFFLDNMISLQYYKTFHKKQHQRQTNFQISNFKLRLTNGQMAKCKSVSNCNGQFYHIVHENNYNIIVCKKLTKSKQPSSSHKKLYVFIDELLSIRPLLDA